MREKNFDKLEKIHRKFERIRRRDIYKKSLVANEKRYLYYGTEEFKYIDRMARGRLTKDELEQLPPDLRIAVIRRRIGLWKALRLRLGDEEDILKTELELRTF
jgi:hypothetical protein